MATPSTIILGGPDPARVELALDAAVDITPGMLCIRASATEVGFHNLAGQQAQRLFALENPWKEATGDTIDEAYTEDGENVLLGYFAPGAQVYAWLATGENVTAGTALESDGAGALQAVATDTATDDTERHSIVAFADEDVNNTGGGTGPNGSARIKVRVA